MSYSESIPYIKCNIAQGDCAVIEAAAGTGKTFNITNITARIIMERNDVTIDKMVIVTFTRAAAGELKTRISQRLAELEKEVQLPQSEDELIKIALKKGVSKEDIRKRLRMALLNFDRAMIGTIHSFAMRSLSENGFDSRLKFGFTLNEGTSKFVLQLCNDFLRGFFYDKEHTELELHLRDLSKDYAQTVSDYVFKRLADPALKICWPEDLPELTGSRDFFELHEENKRRTDEEILRYNEQRSRKLAEWEAERPVLEARRDELDKELKEVKKALKKAVKENDQSLIAQLQRQCSEKNEEFEKTKERFTAVGLELRHFDSRTQKGKEKLMGRYKNSARALLKFLCEQAFEHASKGYRTLCEEKNFLGNDDLILELQKALHQSNSALVSKLRASFPVGLIDEFQDTNDSQFDIFRKIFLENPQSTFIVVGDPRQAIYRFRNCDIQTYLSAKQEMLDKRQAELFSMNTNRRSGEKYIKALNDIFSKGAFAMGDTMDMPVQKALENSKVLLDPKGKEITDPIRIAYKDDMSSEAVSKWCAADICKLLKEGFRLPGTQERAERPVEFGDMTVLTCSWRKAAEIRKELEKRGIPARLMKSDNVFKSLQADQLALFLEGVLNYNNRDALLRALITPLGDLTIEMLDSEEIITERARWMQELNTLWHKRSFMVMYNELFIRFKVNDRLAAQTGGNRDLSNFNTIADILCEESFTRKLTPGALLRSLQKYIQTAEDEKESYPARPETDQGTVLIDTVFGSKGLSYPVVFLPDLFYLGKTFDADRVTKTFHAGDELRYAPFPDDSQLDTARLEMFQENLRKAYVALTRARYCCRVYCGKQSSYCAATDWLFREIPEKRSGAAPVSMPDTKKAPFAFPVPAEEIKGDLPEDKFETPSADVLRRPDLMPYLAFQSGFLSFTSITPHSTSSNAFAGDKYDEGESGDEGESSPEKQPKDEKEEKLPDTFSLPQGTALGNAIHTALEICDYAADFDTLLPLVRKQFNIHGLSGEKHGETATGMLHRMLNTPIDDGFGKSFKLSEIPAADKKCEFEFLYEFSSKFQTSELFDIATAYFEDKFKIRCPEMTDRNNTFDDGFFNGSIDLFFRYNGRFYIIDWKTNKLAAPHLYDNGKLSYAMAASRYYLQYMIYTTALFKYLKERMQGSEDEETFYKNTMGGVRYIFLRGFTGIDGRGVFSDHLPYGMVKKLEGIIG